MAGPKRLPSFPPIGTAEAATSTPRKTGTDLRYVRVPQALYEVSYPALGDPQTARRIHDLTGAVMTEDWGIDHGVWTLFVHMFP